MKELRIKGREKKKKNSLFIPLPPSCFFPKVHRLCELPKHYKLLLLPKQQTAETTCQPPHRLVCFVVYCYTNVHQYRKTSRFPLAQACAGIFKTSEEAATWICCCSTFVAMLCSGKQPRFYVWLNDYISFKVCSCKQTSPPLFIAKTRPKQTSVSHLRLMRQTACSSVLACCFPFTTMVPTPPCRAPLGGLCRGKGRPAPTARPGPVHRAQNCPRAHFLRPGPSARSGQNAS